RNSIDELLDVDSITWTEEPYRGLETFDVEHAPIFYGREEETCDLLQRLRDQQEAGCAFVVIVGASGSGKSSLARAGVAANLVQHADDEGGKWQVSAFIPTLADQSLCYTLVRAIGEVLPELIDSEEATTNLTEGLAENAALTVKLTIAPAFTRAGEPVRLLLILDQMEELWTDRNTTAEDRESFLAALKALAESGHVAVLATLRSDFYPHAQQSPTFLQLKGKLGHVDLLAPDAASVQRLITEPARLAGLKFEQHEQSGRSLDEVILQDAAHDADALPLLEYTLSELYRQRNQEERLLTYAAYVELGGVEGAIGKRAEETFVALPADAQAALDEILPLLVSVDVAGEQAAVRRRAKVSDLTATPARQTLTDQLVAARFLTTDREGETPIASLAHEALLRSWDRIVGWINANRQQLRLRARVEQQQQRWEQQDREESLLLADGLPLDEGRQLVEEAPYLLTASTKDYIDASIAHQESNARKSRRVRTVVLSTIAALVVAMATGGFIAWQINEQNQQQAALEQRATAASGLVQRLLDVEALGLKVAID
ncbi:MAG: ATP-binding protein, partial [Planctomycetes bacterium]|nr:ATP-binding protein [Planctomycetota bacterium]